MITDKRKEELRDSAGLMLLAPTPTAQCRVDSHEEALFLTVLLSERGKVVMEPLDRHYNVVFLTRFSAAV